MSRPYSRELRKLRQLRAWFYLAHIFYIVQQLHDLVIRNHRNDKLCPGVVHRQRPRMYDDEDDVPALARTSNMNADLGMIAVLQR